MAEEQEENKVLITMVYEGPCILDTKKRGGKWRLIDKDDRVGQPRAYASKEMTKGRVIGEVREMLSRDDTGSVITPPGKYVRSYKGVFLEDWFAAAAAFEVEQRLEKQRQDGADSKTEECLTYLHNHYERMVGDRRRRAAFLAYCIEIITGR